MLPAGTWSVIRVRQVCRFAWSQTHQRCSPGSREMTLMRGGRSFAYVPCPLCLLARRRGGSVGSRYGVLFFPRVLVEFVGLKGRPTHPLRRGGLVQVALNPLPQGVELLP